MELYNIQVYFPVEEKDLATHESLDACIKEFAYYHLDDDPETFDVEYCEGYLVFGFEYFEPNVIGVPWLLKTANEHCKTWPLVSVCNRLKERTDFLVFVHDQFLVCPKLKSAKEFAKIGSAPKGSVICRVSSFRVSVLFWGTT